MSKRTISVLLIEDDPVAAGLFRSQLASDFTTDFDFERVASLGEALERLAASTYDVVVLDLLLPDAKGLEPVERLRAEAGHLPLVVLTGLDDEDLAVQALIRGAQDYLVKGDLGGRLISRSLRYAIERQRLTETLRELSLLDEPTALFNRRGFLTLAERQLTIAQRMGRGVALIGIGTSGSAAEQAAGLRYVAELLRGTFRGSDLLARLAERRFAVLAVESSREGAEAALGRLLRHHAEDREVHSAADSLELATHFDWLPADRLGTVEELLERAGAL